MLEEHGVVVGSTQKSDLPQPPEDSAKQEPNADGIEESEAIVLRHTPVCCPVFVKDCSELNVERLRVLGIKLQGLTACCGAAELLKQLVISPEEAAKHDLLAMQLVKLVCWVVTLYLLHT